MTDKPRKRIDELDALRGLAAFGIVFCHLFDSYDHYFEHQFAVPFVFKYFALAVHLFFIVSGFVIFMTLDRVKKPMDFIVSRLSRLYPVYWLAIAITFTCVTLYNLPILGVSWKTAAFNFSMLQGYLPMRHVDKVYWTLTLELSFYAWMFCLFMTKQLPKIHSICVAWMALALGWHLIGLEPTAVTKAVERLMIFEYCYLFAAGIMFFKVWSDTASWKTYAVLAMTYGMAAYTLPTIDACVVAVFYGMFYAMLQGKLRFLSLKPFLFLGTISYSLYLIHQNLGYIVIHQGYAWGVNPLVSIAVATVAALLIATAMNRYVEVPAMLAVRRVYKENRGIFGWLAARDNFLMREQSASAVEVPTAAAVEPVQASDVKPWQVPAAPSVVDENGVEFSDDLPEEAVVETSDS